MENDLRFSILGVGHPLLDLIANVSEEFLKKYDLEANDAILASKNHENLCQELIQNFLVQYIPGGSIQNAIRVAQWFFKQPEVCTIFGCIGNDKFGLEMKEKIQREHVKPVYMIDECIQTGTCACLITNHFRSLISFLGASHSFNLDHIDKNETFINRAKIIYISGFFLVSNPKSTFKLANIAHHSNKIFVFNLSAPYVAKNYSERILQLFPFIDLLFGNKSEVLTLAQTLGWQEKDLSIIVKKLATLEGHQRKPRMVIITQGSDDIVLFDDTNCSLLQYPVPSVPSNEIIDTNGSGDAFVGGFLAYRLVNKSLKECLDAGIYAAQEVIRRSGCTLPDQNRLRL